uniref:NAD(P)/FAD-dependent oxidoreductase n=1 Tax=Cyanobium sp. TaxID=2164130 RepID=UPI004047CDA3
MVGAGPSGGELARLLAQAGVDVVLVDRLSDLGDAAFSSAALPLSALDRFGLPAQVVAARWRGLQLVGPGAYGSEEGTQGRHWMAAEPLGAVLDFGALRRWLASQAQGWGAELQLGWRAVDCGPQTSTASPLMGSKMTTILRGSDGQQRTITSDWVVDASGESRALLGEGASRQDPLVTGVGVEWLLQLPGDQASIWSDRLTFFLGSFWVQQGYGWIFPMAHNQLKVGVCRLIDPRRCQPPLTAELAKVLQAADLQTATVLDRHGGRIRSSVRRREPHQKGRLIGLGDVVSTANLLGGEGIRHALTSSRVLAPLLQEALQSPSQAERILERYPRQLRQALGWRWSLSGRLARRTWLGLSNAKADQRLERLLNGLQTKRAEDLSALLFDYRFERYGLKALPYLWARS